VQKNSVIVNTLHRICKPIRQVAPPALVLASKLKFFLLVTYYVDLWPFDLWRRSRVSRVMGFLRAIFQLAISFHSRL